MSSMLMGSNDSFMQSYWANASTSGTKSRNFHPSYDGMSATLAPSALDMSPHHFQYNQIPNPASTIPGVNPPYLSFDNNLLDFSKGFMPATNSSHGSGTVTPAGFDSGGWDAFINDSSWAENTT